MDLLRIFHTLRHCRLEQITAQVAHRLPGSHGKALAAARTPAPAFPGCRAPATWAPPQPLTGENTAETLTGGTFSFVHLSDEAGWPPAWHADNMPMLWRYNLHYLDWIWTLPFDQAKEATLDWIEKNPVDRGGVGWDPYPVSLRLINLSLYFFQTHREETLSDTSFRDALWPPLFQQAKWLQKNLEIRLLGNHLLENLVALQIFSTCFSGQEDFSPPRLIKELNEQMLDDGTHFELSPMYHLRILYLLELLDGLQCDIPNGQLFTARNAAAALTHPDGEVALFNDGAFNVYPPVSPATDEAPWMLSDAGYYGWRDRVGNYLICDVGAIGPDYIPGHAHADCLSFEWSVRGKRFMVDSGVYDYVPSEMREYCRSTAAHNTVEINGADQCECWGAFRVARRGYPTLETYEPRETGFTLAASHNGYERLQKGLRHHRQFDYQGPDHLTLTDRVDAKTDATAISRLHFHPDWKIVTIDGLVAQLEGNNTKATITYTGDGTLRQETSWYCPEFHTRIENDCLAFETTAPGSWSTDIRIDPLHDL